MIQLKPHVLALRNWLLENYKLLLLSLLLACISVPKYELIYTSGSVDGPLAWVFNYLADGHFSLGQKLNFPHGPLVFLLYPLQMANNFYVALAVQLFCSVFLCMSLFKIHSFNNPTNYSTLTILLFVLLSFADLQLQIIAITIGQVTLFNKTGKKVNLIAALLFSVFNLYIKSYGGLICILVLIGEFLFQLFQKMGWKSILQIPIYYSLFFFMFWFAIYHNFSNALSFLRGQFELSSNNSEAVLFNQENNWWLIGICLVSLICIPFLSKNKSIRFFFFIMLLPLFGAWKHALARGEVIHLVGFLNFLLLFTFLMWIISNENNFRITILCLVSISAFTLTLTKIEDFNIQKNINLFKYSNLYHQITNYDSIACKNKLYMRENLSWRDTYLSDTILKLVGKNTVDVFPWNYAVIGGNNLNWIPRPVIHSYASYTGWLDEQNSKHILSGNSAQFMIWELNDMDENGSKLDGIDMRYLLNDEPKSIISFFSHYNLKIKTPHYLVYEKRPSPLEVKTSTISLHKKIKYNEWVNVPDAHSKGIIRAKLKIKKSFLGVIKSFFYKGESFYVYYELENNQVCCYRIVPKNAEDGLWLNPYVGHPETNFREPRVKRIKITCLNERMVEPEMEIVFEEIEFQKKNQGENKTININEHCFQKNQIQKSPFVSFSQRRAESDLNTHNSLHNAVDQKTSSTSLSGNLSYELLPGKISPLLIYKADSSAFKGGIKFIKFQFEAYLKSNKHTTALLVVSRNNKLLWTRAIKDIMVQNDTFWNYCFISNTISVDEINPDQPFQFYISNVGSDETIYVDDLTLVVEGLKH